jgi:hypothetical protein
VSNPQDQVSTTTREDLEKLRLAALQSKTKRRKPDAVKAEKLAELVDLTGDTEESNQIFQPTTIPCVTPLGGLSDQCKQETTEINTMDLSVGNSTLVHAIYREASNGEQRADARSESAQAPAFSTTAEPARTEENPLVSEDTDTAETPKAVASYYKSLDYVDDTSTPPGAQIIVNEQRNDTIWNTLEAMVEPAENAAFEKDRYVSVPNSFVRKGDISTEDTVAESTMRMEVDATENEAPPEESVSNEVPLDETSMLLLRYALSLMILRSLFL